MRIIARTTLVAVLAAAVALSATQASAVPASDTGAVVERALAARGPDQAGPARPAVDARSDAKSVTVSGDGVSHTVTAVDRRNSEVRRLADGGQVITVLRHGTTARYDVTPQPGWTLQPSGAGFLITHPGTDETGVIEAPWAIDANGKQIRTWYTAEGNQLVQHVDATGARYPLTLDPKLTYGRGVYLNMWGHEVQAALAALIAMGGGAAYITCQGLSKLPGGVKKVLDVVCKVSGAAAAVTIRNILQTLKSLKDIKAWDCYQKRIVPNQGSWKIVNGKNCS
ncbi:hypothetical protein [Kribbella sp. NPDC051770]|uniref:hypothetical protein n=1 Tax=Kribbella sp. NPDC051770 TaxID=3155413 RepID=UPI00341BEFEF